MNEREAFEAWAGPITALAKENGQYVEVMTSLAWEAWQARAALRDAPQQAEPKRCPSCDDTGDVHSIDGEWRGTCNCPAGQATPSAPTAVEPTAEKVSVVEPQTIVAERDPHPNAFMQVPKGTEIKAHWPRLVEPDERAACEWSDDDYGNWESSCGELWSFIDGGPKENRVSFCHHCGKPAVVRASKGTK